MNNILKKTVRKTKKEEKVDFLKECDVLILDMFDNIIKLVGLKNSKLLNEQFLIILKDFKIKYSSKIKKIYYFQDTLNENTITREIIPSITIHEFINELFESYSKYFFRTNNRLFKYIIIEFSTKDNEVKQEIITLLSRSMYDLFKKFTIEIGVFYRYTSEEHEKYLDFHSICQGIYSSYNMNKQEPYRSSEYEVDKKIGKVNKILTVKEFILYINESISRIKHDITPLHSAKFLLQDEREYKYLREEYIAIKSYIFHTNLNEEMDIELGEETKPWDAKINLENESIIIEVTQALPKNEHKTRQRLATNMHGYKGFSLELRTVHQQGVDSFPQPIIDSIEKKHIKNYDEPRVLLVVVLSEFAYNDEFIFNEWLNSIKEETYLGQFREIYLVVDAEKLYQLH